MNPFTAPRQSSSERWKPSKATLKYRANRDELSFYLKDYPEIKKLKALEIDFILPMAKSWSAKKREINRNFPHTQKPDIDNLIKAFLDTLYRNEDDSKVYKIIATKYWGDEGEICINI